MCVSGNSHYYASLKEMGGTALVRGGGHVLPLYKAAAACIVVLLR